MSTKKLEALRALQLCVMLFSSKFTPKKAVYGDHEWWLLNEAIHETEHNQKSNTIFWICGMTFCWRLWASKPNFKIWSIELYNSFETIKHQYMTQEFCRTYAEHYATQINHQSLILTKSITNFNQTKHITIEIGHYTMSNF